MKLLKNIPLLILAVFFLFTACRTEDEEIITPSEQQLLTSDSSTANLITRVSTNDGSNDNILDNANCLNIQLPVTVLIDDLEIIINSEDDFDTIEDIFDEFINDVDELEFVFPITIILSDFTEITIANAEELETLIDDCSGENETDDDIECIDFQYPIVYSIFDQNNELIETVTINNDEEHYEFIDTLDETDIVSINFPLTLILSNGDTVTVSNIIELNNAIEDAIDDCDEDDDNDYDDDDCEDCNSSTLIEAFDSCESAFIVDEFILNGADNADQYDGFTFDFNANGTVIVESNGVIFQGTWTFSGEGNESTFELSIPELEDFNNVWEVVEIENDDEEIVFVLNNQEDYIVFLCDGEEEEDFDCPDLEANIGDTCESQNGNNGTINENCECVVEEEFDCPNLEANIGDTCESQNGNDGTISEDCECVEEETFDCPNLEANIGDACDSQNGNDGTISEDCECVEEGEDTLEAILIDGEWIATADTSNGNLEVILQGFVFDFEDGNLVIATDSSGSLNGFWEVSNNDTLFELEFPNDSSGLFLLNNTYTVISIEVDRIELAFEDNPSELLIFEKN